MGREGGKHNPAESYRKKQSNMYSRIPVSLFKGHTSIPWIQISVEKAYQSNFLSHPQNQSRLKRTMLKAISLPSL